MEKTEILSVVLGLLSVVMSFIGYYFYIKSRIYKSSEKAINNAEVEGESGKQKLESATRELWRIVPNVLKPFISYECIKAIVQSAFDKIEEYAKKQKTLDKTTE